MRGQTAGEATGAFAAYAVRANEVAARLRLVITAQKNKLHELKGQLKAARVLYKDANDENERLWLEFWSIGEALKGEETAEAEGGDIEEFLEEIKKQGPGPSLAEQVMALKLSRDRVWEELEDVKQSPKESS